MKPKSGLHYELVAKMVFDEIHRRSDIKTVEVKHDVTLRGLRVEHQIDLYWSFVQGEIVYTTIVQVKNWKTPVTQGELLKFKAVLDDLPGQPRGIFVTRSGYQSGAKEVAAREGILLYELQPLSKTDPNKDINVGFIEFSFSTVEHNNVRVVPDADWLRQNGIKLSNVKTNTNQIVFYDESGNELQNLTNLLRDYNDQPKLEAATEVFHEFEQPTFCKSADNKFPFHKVLGVRLVLEPKEWSETVPALGPDIVGFILKNVNDNSIQKFDWKPGLRKVME
jgi:hypothetical protein